MKPSRPFSDTTQEMLKDPELTALSLEECLKDGDMELFTAALKDVADACGGLTSLSQSNALLSSNQEDH
jgi:DNA-binding phage protein